MNRTRGLLAGLHRDGRIILQLGFTACQDPYRHPGYQPERHTFGRQNSPLGRLLILMTKTGPDIDDADAVLQNHTLLALIVRHAFAVVRLRGRLILRAEDEIPRGGGDGAISRVEHILNEAVEAVAVHLGHRLRRRYFAFGKRLVDESTEISALLGRGQCRDQGHQADQGQRGNQSPHDSHRGGEDCQGL